MTTASLAGRYGAVYETPVLEPFALDTYAETTLTLCTHVPDTPGSGAYSVVRTTGASDCGTFWTSSGGYMYMNFGGAERDALTTADASAGETDGVWYFDFTRNTLNAGGGLGIVELRFRSIDNAPFNTAAEFLALRLRALNTTQLGVSVLRKVAGGGYAQTSSESTVSCADSGGQLRFGCTIIGTALTAFTEPHGGGTRTTLSASLTLTATYQDSSHRRFGWRGIPAAGGGVNVEVRTMTGEGVPARVGELRGWRVRADHEILETSSTDARLIIPGERSWSATADLFFVGANSPQTDLRDGVITPQELAFHFYPSTGSTGYVWTGDGYVTDFSIQGEGSGAVMHDVVIDGDGPLTEGG